MCEEYNHWAELVFLYVQYDEFDNAALIMIAHSPTAWEHSHFKDVLVKVRALIKLRTDFSVSFTGCWMR